MINVIYGDGVGIIGLFSASQRYPVVSLRMATGVAAQTSCTLTAWDGMDGMY